MHEGRSTRVTKNETLTKFLQCVLSRNICCFIQRLYTVKKSKFDHEYKKALAQKSANKNSSWIQSANLVIPLEMETKDLNIDSFAR